VLLFVVLAAGCKQGLGDRCQVMSDCESPLVCNSATNTCQETSGGGIDATVPDGGKLDAAIDAPVDAPKDAITAD
jgi:hypothetical protein